jgi:hypothetical protein
MAWRRWSDVLSKETLADRQAGDPQFAAAWTNTRQEISVDVGVAGGHAKVTSSCHRYGPARNGILLATAETPHVRLGCLATATTLFDGEPSTDKGPKHEPPFRNGRLHLPHLVNAPRARSVCLVEAAAWPGRLPPWLVGQLTSARSPQWCPGRQRRCGLLDLLLLRPVLLDLRHGF